MPTSPFGLAYGLGQALSGLPQAMNQRENEALATQMRGLQLRQMQRQEAEREAIDQAAMAVRPEQETVLEGGLGPTPVSGVSDETQESMKRLNLPVASAVPTPTATQMEGAKTPLTMVTRQKTYTSPHQAAAYRYGAMADYLFKQGMVEPAMRLQQQAQQATQLHQASALGQAARMAAIGDYGNATRMLNGIGMGITGMNTSPDDPETVQIHSMMNGQPVVSDVPKDALGAVIEDPIRGMQMLSTMNWRRSSIESRERMKTAQIQSTEKQKELDRQNRIDLANIRASRPSSLAGMANTADERKVAALVRDTGISLEEAWDRVKPGIESRGRITDKDRLNAIKFEQSSLIKSAGGIPRKGDPEFEAYTANQQAIEGLTKGRPTKAVLPPTAKSISMSEVEDAIKPGGKYAGRSKDEVIAALKSNGYEVK